MQTSPHVTSRAGGCQSTWPGAPSCLRTLMHEYCGKMSMLAARGGSTSGSVVLVYVLCQLAGYVVGYSMSFSLCLCWSCVVCSGGTVRVVPCGSCGGTDQCSPFGSCPCNIVAGGRPTAFNRLQRVKVCRTVACSRSLRQLQIFPLSALSRLPLGLSWGGVEEERGAGGRGRT